MWHQLRLCLLSLFDIVADAVMMFRWAFICVWERNGTFLDWFWKYVTVPANYNACHVVCSEFSDIWLPTWRCVFAFWHSCDCSCSHSYNASLWFHTVLAVIHKREVHSLLYWPSKWNSIAFTCHTIAKLWDWFFHHRLRSSMYWRMPFWTWAKA